MKTYRIVEKNDGLFVIEKKLFWGWTRILHVGGFSAEFETAKEAEKAILQIETKDRVVKVIEIE